MSKGAWAAWAVKNSVVLLCFTSLAIHFDKWWIILFSVICLSSLKTESGTRRVCDGCGRVIDLDGEARRAGWLRRKSGDSWEDYCPECQRIGVDRHED